MKNRKAWIRIAETFLAIIMILFVVLLIISRQKAEANKEEELTKLLSSTLSYIRQDEGLRGQILSNNVAGVYELIRNLAPAWMNYSAVICPYDDICPNPAGYLQKKVYSNEIIITSNLTYKSQTTSKIKIFLWEK